MGQPNWNDVSSTIDVDPPSLETLATVSIKNSASAFVGHINGCGTIWQGLALGWNGQTYAEAEDFNRRWTSTMTHLFGVEGDDSQPGVINQIARVVYYAAGNFANAEHGVAKSFQMMSDGYDQAAADAAAEGDPQIIVNDDGTTSLPPSDIPGDDSDSRLPPVTIDYHDNE